MEPFAVELAGRDVLQTSDLCRSGSVFEDRGGQVGGQYGTVVARSAPGGDALSARTGSHIEDLAALLDAGKVEHALGGGTEPALQQRRPIAPAAGVLLPLLAGGRLVPICIECHRLVLVVVHVVVVVHVHVLVLVLVWSRCHP